MRFERLDLERYGHFTGHSIEFGAPTKTGDFHLIYGPNEAGKSTLRDACIDFLFGFERITPYNFKHPNASLLIGAEININGEKISAQRIKGGLLASSGEPMSEGLLKAALGEVTRAHYLQMFSLDEDTLVDGGNEILKSQGDLGALLFSAASGLSSISSSLDSIQQQADKFYKPSGRIFGLNEHIKTLKILKDELKQIDLQAPAYERLRKEAAQAETFHTEAKSQRDKNLDRLQQLGSLLQAVEIHVDYTEVIGKLAALDDAPDVADGFRQEVEQLARDIAASSSRLVESQQALDRSTATFNKIEPDTIVLENAAAIHRLSEDEIESRYRTSSDIEHRERDIDACKKEIQSILQKLGQVDCAAPRTLLIPSAVLGNVSELLDQQSGLLVDLKNSSAELSQAKELRAELQQAYEKYSTLADLSDVSIRLNTLKSVADPEIAKSKNAHLEATQQELNEAIAALSPWKGSTIELQEIAPPDPYMIQNLGTKSDQLSEQQKQLSNEIARLETDIAGQKAMLLSLKSTTGLIEDHKAKFIRDARSEAWTAHVAEFENNNKPSPDGLRKSAGVFKAAMQEDDTSSQVRLSQSTELASLKQVEMELAKSTAYLQAVQIQKKEVDTNLGNVTGRISELMVQVGLPKTSDLKFLTPWLEKRDYALRRDKAFLTAKSDAEKYEKRCNDARSNLQKSMIDAGVLSNEKNQDWQVLVIRCEIIIAHWEEETRLRDQTQKSLANADAQQKNRKRQHDRIGDLDDEWQMSWASALSNTWMAKARPVEVKYSLQLLDDLDTVYTKLDDFHQRIVDMRRNRILYITEVNRLARTIGMQNETTNLDQDALQIADQLRLRLAQAEEDQRRLIERQKVVNEDKERLISFQDNFHTYKSQEEALCKKLNVGNLKEMLNQLKRSEEKASLHLQADQLGKSIKKILGVEELENGLSLLQEQCTTVEALSELRQEHASLKQDQNAEQEHLAQLYHQLKDAEQRLAAVGDDANVARLAEQRQVLLLQVEQEAQSYMRLVAGTLMVGEALRTYRDVHRSAMMQRASTAFVQITRDNFSGLTSTPGKNGDILVGIRSDGTSIEVDQMSRGTTFQLYLALRIAGHAEFAKSRKALPFFADDILEPFDDDRSAETFKLLAEMSKLGQVVYLTHHQHLCQIAHNVCGEGVKLHNLPVAKSVL